MTDDYLPSTASNYDIDPATPSVRRVVLGLISDYGTISHDLLVSMTHTETDASASLIRTTINRLQAEGEIYRVADSWKVTRP